MTVSFECVCFCWCCLVLTYFVAASYLDYIVSQKKMSGAEFSPVMEICPTLGRFQYLSPWADLGRGYVPHRVALTRGGKWAKIVKKIHRKIQIVCRWLCSFRLQIQLQTKALLSSKFKELDIDSCSALTLLQWNDNDYGITYHSGVGICWDAAQYNCCSQDLPDDVHFRNCIWTQLF